MTKLQQKDFSVSKRIAAIFAALVACVLLVGCSGSSNSAAKNANTAARAAVKSVNSTLKAPDTSNLTEYNNYYKAQTLYNDPSTIIWCTTTWGNANSPLVTVPIAGKLTSSSVSLFPSTQSKEGSNGGVTYNPELPSVDGMYHGTPPAYQYGFTPGGQYVQFTNMEYFCTTSLTSFQRASTQIDITDDTTMNAAQTKAEADLKACQAGSDVENGATSKTSCAAAQKDLQDGLGTK